MLNLQRYEPCCCSESAEEGQFVKYSDVERLIAERKSLQKDAERYRWLRDNAVSEGDVWCVHGANGLYYNDPIDSSQLDNAVDEAIKKYLED